MSKTFISYVRPFMMTLALGGALAGCGGDETVSSSAAGFDRVVKPLLSPGGVALAPKAIKGSYSSGCKVNAGTTWDLKLNDSTDNSLSVALNDAFSTCKLTLQAIQVQEGTNTTLVDYPLAPEIVLGNTYANSPSAVNKGTALQFYTNAKLSGLASTIYSNNFQINLLWSDDALACGNIAPPAVYATVTATATGSSVTPPNYMMTFDSLKLVVDANRVVQNTSSGNVVLSLPTTGPMQGDEYKIFDDTMGCCSSFSFAEIDALYKGNTAIGSAVAITNGSPINIPWTAFALAGKTLKVSRFVVVKRNGAAGSGVYSYELLDVAFPGPNP